jgi:hypothetical protein
MADREQAIAYLANMKRNLTARKDELMRPVQELDKEVEHVTATLAILLRNKTSEAIEQSEFPLEKLRGLSQTQAVIAIARHNGGVIKAQDAKRIMIQAKVMRDTQNSTNMTHNAILQSEKFERIGRGEFRLKESKADEADKNRRLFQAVQ